MQNFKLSEHFSFYELTNTSHTDLLEDNRAEAMEQIETLKALAECILEPLRVKIDRKIFINSGYRGKTLNEAVGGAKLSQHCYAEAADIDADGYTAEELFNFIRENEEIFDGKLGQVILEKVGGAEWVHISYKSKRYAQVLISKYGSDDTVFLTTNDGKNYFVV